MPVPALIAGGRAIATLAAKKGLLKGAGRLLGRLGGKKGLKRVVGAAGAAATIGAVMPGGLRIAHGPRKIGPMAEGFGLFGRERGRYRRMNMGNPRALSRAIRRVEGATKQYGRLLSATRGTKIGGYTIKPRKRGKACR